MKRIAYIFAALLLCLDTLRAEVYTIDFNRGTKSGTKLETSVTNGETAASLCSAGADYIKEVAASRCYYNTSGCGIRVGKTSGIAGQPNIVFTLCDEIQAKYVVKIVVYASRGTSAADADFGVYAGTSEATQTTSFADMKDYDATFPESSNYMLPEIILERRFKMLKVQAQNTNYIVLHRIDIYTADEASLTLSAAKDNTYYTTFSSDKAVFFPFGVTPFKAMVRNDRLELTALEPQNCADMSDGRFVPANTGVLLSSANEEVSYYVLDGRTFDVLTDNMLRPASEAMTGNNKFYKLAYDEEANPARLGFYWGVEDGGTFACEEGAAYLAVPNASCKENYVLDETTFEDAILFPREFVDEMGVFYNLSGQRISKPSRGGIYIHGGKKHLVW